MLRNSVDVIELNLPIAWAEITLFQTKSHQISVKLWQKELLLKKERFENCTYFKTFELVSISESGKGVLWSNKGVLLLFVGEV